MKVIKRYQNRKFYHNGKYVNLIDIVQMVKNNEEILVVNARKQDVTIQTLVAALAKYAEFTRLDDVRELVKLFTVKESDNG